MKKIQAIMMFLTFVSGILYLSCKKDQCSDKGYSSSVCDNRYPLKPYYTPFNDFTGGMEKVVTDIKVNNVYAFLDTLPNGYPDVEGRKNPLYDFASSIMDELNSSNEIDSGLYDIFHFDGSSFSLISYLMKAQMAENISPQTLISIIDDIPLPPFPVDNYDPPQYVNSPDTVANCCDSCRPDVQIHVSWTFKPACGNYVDTVKGYAANNTLKQSSGRLYRFTPEVRGCTCPGGVWTYTVEAPDGASYGVTPGSSINGVNLLPLSSGTYKVTFTYNVCGKTATKTFTVIIS
jgi:hypothetical protein